MHEHSAAKHVLQGYYARRLRPINHLQVVRFGYTLPSETLKEGLQQLQNIFTILKDAVMCRACLKILKGTETAAEGDSSLFRSHFSHHQLNVGQLI